MSWSTPIVVWEALGAVGDTPPNRSIKHMLCYSPRSSKASAEIYIRNAPIT